MANHGLAIALMTGALLLPLAEASAQRGAPPPGPRLQTEARPTGSNIVVVNLRGEETVLPGLKDSFQ